MVLLKHGLLLWLQHDFPHAVHVCGAQSVCVAWWLSQRVALLVLILSYR